MVLDVSSISVKEKILSSEKTSLLKEMVHVLYLEEGTTDNQCLEAEEQPLVLHFEKHLENKCCPRIS